MTITKGIKMKYEIRIYNKRKRVATFKYKTFIGMIFNYATSIEKKYDRVVFYIAKDK